MTIMIDKEARSRLLEPAASSSRIHASALHAPGQIEMSTIIIGYIYVPSQ